MGMTTRDHKHIARTRAALVYLRDVDCTYCNEEDGGHGPCRSDCYISETIMTSTGYVDVRASDEDEDDA